MIQKCFPRICLRNLSQANFFLFDCLTISYLTTQKTLPVPHPRLVFRPIFTANKVTF